MKLTSRREFLGSVSGVVVGAVSLGSFGCSEPPPEAPAEMPVDGRTAWYRDARFGLFVHWGPYSVAGVEASWPIMAPQWFADDAVGISEADYVALAKKFNPVQYDPRAWVKVAQDAGMRYIVFTTKHHDGFCMFDAPGTEYKITNTPYGKDIVAELAEACREAEMPLGFYYSPPDMHHPGYRDTSKPGTENWNGEPDRAEWGSYLDYMESHLRKLLTDYGDVVLVWFDGLFEQGKYDPPRFHKLIHELSPATLINDRLGEEWDYVTPEQFFPGGIPVKRTDPRPVVTAADVDKFFKIAKALPKEQVAELMQAFSKDMYPTKKHPTPEEFQLWETCMTMNNTWGYNPDDTEFKPAETLIQNLVEVSSRGGNFLLNVGPSPEGTIPAESVERLARIGEWMKVNGEAVYGTTYGPLQDVDELRSTTKPGVVYLHVLEWPGDELEIDDFPGKVSGVRLLASGESLSFKQEEKDLAIKLPAEAPDAVASVIAIQV